MGTPTIEWVREGVGFTPAAAASFRRAEAALGRRIDVNSSYRDYQKQLAMYEAWNRYVASGYKQSLYPGHSRAIHPDQSVHCQGRALDSDDWTRPGFNTFMADHGWFRTAAGDPTEQHHFEYQSWRDQHRNQPAGGDEKPSPTPVPASPEEEDEDMKMKGAFYTRAADKAVVYLLFNEISGFYVEHTGVTGTYNNDIAARWETNSWAGITESHAKVLKAALDKTRTRG